MPCNHLFEANNDVFVTPGLFCLMYLCLLSKVARGYKPALVILLCLLIYLEEYALG
jgi:hypothetical protein